VQEDGQCVPDEVDLLRRVDHVPGVLRLLDYYRHADGHVLVLERPSRGVDLFDYVTERGALDEADARRVFRRVVETLRLVHDAGVVHRDVKDENVILDLDTGDVSLIDFGSGARLHDGVYRDFDGQFVLRCSISVGPLLLCFRLSGLYFSEGCSRLDGGSQKRPIGNCWSKVFSPGYPSPSIFHF